MLNGKLPNLMPIKFSRYTAICTHAAKKLLPLSDLVLLGGTGAMGGAIGVLVDICICINIISQT